MKITIEFIITSIMLGVGLAMDAFSVSVANGLNEPKMKKNKMLLIAGVFAIFQALMPMIGWTCVHTIVCYFKAFEKFIPWIALVLLLFIGGNMIKEAVSKDEDDKEAGEEAASEDKNKDKKNECKAVCMTALMVQGVATSIDALSVGFTIAEYGFGMALLCAVIIAIVTFIICMAGVVVGKKVGIKYSDKASIFGGVILIVIGLEIFLTGTGVL